MDEPRQSGLPAVDEPAGQLTGIRTGELTGFLAIVGQLGAVLWALYVFRVEESFGLPRILPLVFFGFILHAGLPLRLRRPFFLLLSLLAIGVVFGIHYGMALVALGLGLIAVCHLPLPLGARVTLLVAVGALLAGVRAEWIPLPFGRASRLPTLVLPILGSMFMFRLIVYLYDLRHEKEPASLSERLGYFFLLPNVCFPLFPVVDYQTYRRTYYDREPLEVYQKGVRWIFRGMLHLLLYRMIYLYLVPPPAEVQSLGGVVQAMVSTYLLYLRISGQFHLIVGMLCLFGFNLPETHRLYFLASSFNDYWRRINIYWKDFMMKIFYYPSLMRLRRLGVTTAMVAATVVVFAGTWLLHSYQWFWLRGTFPLTGPDALFWGILGTLVVVNSLYEAKRGRRRSLGKQTWSLRDASIHSMKTVGMFVFITVLWSLWSSPTVGEWLSLLSAAGNGGPRDFGLLLSALAVLVAIGVLFQYVASRKWEPLQAWRAPSLGWSGGIAATVALVLVFMSTPEMRPLWGAQTAEVLGSLRENRLNARDAELLERGYYEGLLDADKYTTELWAVQARQPEGWVATRNAPAIRERDDILEYELIPSYQGRYKEADFRVNEWGMRDRPYQRAKSPGTFRMALLGASYEMGAGVEDTQTFENRVEDRLNREHAGGVCERYEILNFSVGGYSTVHNVLVAEGRVFDFEPDVLLFAMHATEESRLQMHLRSAIQNGIHIPYPYLRDVIRQSGATADMDEPEITRRLQPLLYDVIRWSLRQIVEACRRHDVPCVSIFVPTTEERAGINPERFALLSGLAQEEGFLTLSLDGAYGDHREAAIQLARWDEHPNVLGHELLADRLYQELHRQDHELGLGLSPFTPCWADFGSRR